MTDLMTIVGIVGAMAAIVAAVASVKALYPRSTPVIEEPKVSLTVHYGSPPRRGVGHFLARNAGPRPYDITGIAVSYSALRLPCNLVAVNHWPSAGVGVDGTQQLPLSVEGYSSKQVFFHTEDISGRHEGELPSDIKLELRFGCKPTVMVKILHRESNTQQYK